MGKRLPAFDTTYGGAHNQRNESKLTTQLGTEHFGWPSMQNQFQIREDSD